MTIDCTPSTSNACCPYHNPAPICFEENVPQFKVEGLNQRACPEFTVVQAPYPGDGGDPSPNPTSILRVDQGFEVKLAWQCKGPAVHFIVGDWRCAVHLHRVDGDSLHIHKSVDIPMNEDVAEFRVDQAIAFAANSVPVGVYKVYVTVQFVIKGRAWVAMAGFGKGMALSVYDPKAN